MSLEDLDFDKELAEYGLGAGGDFDETVQMGEEKKICNCATLFQTRGEPPFLTRVLDIRMDCVVWSTLQVTMVEKPHEPTCPCYENTNTLILPITKRKKKFTRTARPAKRQRVVATKVI